jgi:hypothetical protein
MILPLPASHWLSLSAVDLTYPSAVANLAGVAVEKGQRLRLTRTINERLGSLLAVHRSLFVQALDHSSLEIVVAVGQQFLKTLFIIADLTTGRILCGGFPESEDELAESLQMEQWPRWSSCSATSTPRSSPLGRCSGIGRGPLWWRGRQAVYGRRGMTWSDDHGSKWQRRRRARRRRTDRLAHTPLSGRASQRPRF